MNRRTFLFGVLAASMPRILVPKKKKLILVGSGVADCNILDPQVYTELFKPETRWDLYRVLDSSNMLLMEWRGNAWVINTDLPRCLS